VIIRGDSQFFKRILMGRIPPPEERAEDYAPQEERLEDYADCVVEERLEDYADCVLEERLEDFAPWVDDRDEDFLPGDAKEVLQVISNLAAAESRAAGAAQRDLKHKEVIGLWNALSFHMWQYGEVMSVHIVILWQTLGVTDHGKARNLLLQYLNRCQKWGKVGLTAPLDRSGESGPCGSPDTVTDSFSAISSRMNATAPGGFIVMS
jgi:hypothetical protein